MYKSKVEGETECGEIWLTTDSQKISTPVPIIHTGHMSYSSGHMSYSSGHKAATEVQGPAGERRGSEPREDGLKLLKRR